MQAVLLTFHLVAMATVLTIIGADAISSGAALKDVTEICVRVLVAQLFVGIFVMLLSRNPSPESSDAEQLSHEPSDDAQPAGSSVSGFPALG
jgi:hypothetical protein